MYYLSPEIAALVQKKKKSSLVYPQKSCGIFQDYGDDTEHAAMASSELNN